jgi:hypothetical protein
MLSVIMLNVIMLSVIMLNVIMLSVIMLNVIMLNVIMLSVIILNVITVSVVAPSIFLEIEFIGKRKNCVFCFPAKKNHHFDRNEKLIVIILSIFLPAATTVNLFTVVIGSKMIRLFNMPMYILSQETSC